jgi:hypothetical protein
MKLSFRRTEEMKALARRVIWFEDPDQSLNDMARLVAYAITYGTTEDISVLRRHVSDADLRDVLESAPPGIIDARSWTYWHLKLGHKTVPPMPVRRFA